jgi:hypothetical protein
MFFSREEVVEDLNRECLEQIEDTTFQDFTPENLPESEHYVDWSAWKPPIFKAALLRRPAPSCYDNDWHNLENEFVSMNEAQAARAYSPEVISHLVSKFVKLGYRPKEILG